MSFWDKPRQVMIEFRETAQVGLSKEGYATPSAGVRIRLIETNSVGDMKRDGLHLSLLALLVMPLVFALGWWARDVNYGHASDGLQRSIAELNTRHQDDLLLDELRGAGVETGGPAALGSADKQAFANQLDRFLARS